MPRNEFCYSSLCTFLSSCPKNQRHRQASLEPVRLQPVRVSRSLAASVRAYSSLRGEVALVSVMEWLLRALASWQEKPRRARMESYQHQACREELLGEPVAVFLAGQARLLFQLQ
jgi:hypothetical protein